MFRARVVLVCLLVLALPATTGAAAGGDATGAAAAGVNVGPPDGARIVGLYPNPVADGDTGEFVVLTVPPDTNLSAYALTDGERRVRLPDRTASGRVVLTAAPERVRGLLAVRTDPPPVVALDRVLGLANGGERVRLLRENRTVSVVRYGDAPEGERYDAATGTWRPLGATDLAVVRGGPATTRAFVLPDGAGVPVETLRRADDRLLLAGYTLTSRRVADALVAAHRRGVSVRVLVEGGPVGGIPQREARVLDRLVRAGVPVHVLDGPAARYRYHHAKYAVVDGRALVLTENWKPSGTGGHSSRGWGAVVRDPAVADRLASVFRADSGWRDGVSWEAFREGRRFEAAQPANGTYPTRTAPRTVRATGTELLVAPDNAGRRVHALVGNATDRVRVLQVSMDRSFARPLLQAARRGVSVRVLLSSAWYVREENRALADRLNRHAEREDLDLTVRLARPDGYGKVHAKGLLVDGETVAVGSLNWNEAAATENREVVVVLHGTAPASYYGEVFARDWRASGERGDGAGVTTGVPAALVGVAGVAVVVALVVARRIEFGDGGPVEGPWRE